MHRWSFYFETSNGRKNNLESHIAFDKVNREQPWNILKYISVKWSMTKHQHQWKIIKKLDKSVAYHQFNSTDILMIWFKMEKQSPTRYELISLSIIFFSDRRRKEINKKITKTVQTKHDVKEYCKTWRKFYLWTELKQKKDNKTLAMKKSSIKRQKWKNKHRKLY